MRFVPLICAIDDGCWVMMRQTSVQQLNAAVLQEHQGAPATLASGTPLLIDGPFAETKELLGGVVAAT